MLPDLSGCVVTFSSSSALLPTHCVQPHCILLCGEEGRALSVFGIDIGRNFGITEHPWGRTSWDSPAPREHHGCSQNWGPFLEDPTPHHVQLPQAGTSLSPFCTLYPLSLGTDRRTHML